MMILVSGATATMREVNDPRLGRFYTPMTGNLVVDDKPWAIDNGAYSKFDEVRYVRLLERCRADGLTGCLFVVAPDVVGDAAATQKLFDVWEPRLRQYGFPIAFVAQDGLTVDTTPWGQMDVLFIGGSTEFKLSAVMRDIAHEATNRGIPIHAGRVNSRRRLRWARHVNARTTDGTYVSKFPKVGIKAMTTFLDDLARQPELAL